jgi:hypothetical protein
VAEAEPGVNFYTDPKEVLQVGTVRYPAGHIIPAHHHQRIMRQPTGDVPESLLVLRGLVEVTLYDTGHRVMGKVTLAEGDAIILFRGGHGFRIWKDTVLFESRQGPYVGAGVDKERWETVDPPVEKP